MSDDVKKYSLPTLPTSIRDPQTGAEVRGQDAPIVTGALAEEMAHALSTQRVCGTCKYFELAHGQALMQGQRFVERLVREEHWQVKHLASPLNDLGVCGAHSSGGKGEDQMLTGRMHKACDQYRDANGGISTARKGSY